MSRTGTVLTEAAATKLAAEIAANSPIAVVSTKHIMNYSRDHGVQEGLTYQVGCAVTSCSSSRVLGTCRCFSPR